MFAEKYNALLRKYLNYEFKSKEDENEYLVHLVLLVNDETVEFEEKIAILQFLVGGVRAGCRIPEISS